MARLYLARVARGARFLALEVDELNDEFTDFVFENLTDTPWTIQYTLKNDQEHDFTIPAQTAETSIGIPPGQRKAIRDGTGKWDTDFRSMKY